MEDSPFWPRGLRVQAQEDEVIVGYPFQPLSNCARGQPDCSALRNNLVECRRFSMLDRILFLAAVWALLGFLRVSDNLV